MIRSGSNTETKPRKKNGFLSVILASLDPDPQHWLHIWIDNTGSNTISCYKNISRSGSDWIELQFKIFFKNVPRE
jgi:hypothetical protein